MFHGVSANGTLLSFYDYDKQTRISPSTYLLTVSDRPVLLRRVAGTAAFWKMKRADDFNFQNIIAGITTKYDQL